ncbi:MAG TPA: hypothetical protein VLJ59_16145 [Mycobacteriales bacterium]|nr:hypothetical protein [Mycobacteriales bacterium]
MTERGLPAHGVRDLKAKVTRHLEELARESLDNENVDLGLATRIADALWSLIDVVADRDEDAKIAVRGAVDYFVLNRDETPDLDSRHGFVDDVKIVNEVCVELGLPELAVRIG